MITEDQYREALRIIQEYEYEQRVQNEPTEKKGGLIVRNKSGTKQGMVYHKDRRKDDHCLVYWNDGSKTLSNSKNIFPIGLTREELTSPPPEPKE